MKISNWTHIFQMGGSTTNQLTTEPNWDDPPIRQVSRGKATLPGIP